MTDPALARLLDGDDPDFEPVVLGSSRDFDAFNLIRRSDGERVGQVRYYNRRAVVLRYDYDDREIASPHPFFCGEDDHGNEFYAPAWETLEEFVASFEKWPFVPGRW